MDDGNVIIEEPDTGLPTLSEDASPSAVAEDGGSSGSEGLLGATRAVTTVNFHYLVGSLFDKEATELFVDTKTFLNASSTSYSELVLSPPLVDGNDVQWLLGVNTFRTLGQNFVEAGFSSQCQILPIGSDESVYGSFVVVSSSRNTVCVRTSVSGDIYLWAIAPGLVDSETLTPDTPSPETPTPETPTSLTPATTEVPIVLIDESQFSVVQGGVSWGLLLLVLGVLVACMILGAVLFNHFSDHWRG